MFTLNANDSYICRDDVFFKYVVTLNANDSYICRDDVLSRKSLYLQKPGYCGRV